MYLVLKLIHVAGVVLFLGNITVGVFWKSYADRSGKLAIMAHTMDAIIAADRIFTIPGIIILLIGGFGAAFVGKWPILSTGWILWGLIAFILAGLAFAPLSRTQRQLSVAAHGGNLEEYERLSNAWNIWGFIALALPIVAFVVMILKPALPAFHR
jgi:uncharacterized membrane protein